MISKWAAAFVCTVKVGHCYCDVILTDNVFIPHFKKPLVDTKECPDFRPRKYGNPTLEPKLKLTLCYICVVSSLSLHECAYNAQYKTIVCFVMFA